MTVSFDHDIVDGAPAARFVQHLRELVEAGLFGNCSRPHTKWIRPGQSAPQSVLDGESACHRTP